MGSHCLSGVRIESALPLEPFAASSNGDALPLLSLALAPAQPQRALPEHTIRNTIELEGAPFLTSARAGDEMVIRLHGWADFVIAGERIRCVPLPGPSPDDLAQLFVDRVLPHVLPFYGIPTLHAAAVALEVGAIAFVGEPGRGKSTIAAELSKSGRWLCDDCAALEVDERVRVWPSYSFVRLNRDSLEAVTGGAAAAPPGGTHTRKLRLKQEAAPAPAPLLAICALGPEEGPFRWEPLSQRDAMAELARHLFRLDPTDRTALSAEMTFLARLVAKLPVVRLRLPRKLELLPEVARRIAAELGAEQPLGGA